MTRAKPIPRFNPEACVICGPCRFAKLGLIAGRTCANHHDCTDCDANRAITERCLALDPTFFDRPLTVQISGMKQVAADVMYAHTCNRCELICPELAITTDPLTGARHIDADHCKSCGLCARYCSNDALKLS